MADKKISDLAEDTSPAAGDYLVTVDLSDPTMASTGTDKKVKISSLLALVPLASAPVTSVAGKTGDVRLSTADVAGLGSAALAAASAFATATQGGKADTALQPISITSGQLLYASAANTLAPLTLGSSLSITAGTLNAAGGKASSGNAGDFQIGDGSGGFVTAMAHPINYDPASGIVSFAGGQIHIDGNGGINLVELRASYAELQNYPNRPATRIIRRIGQSVPLAMIVDEATGATIAGFDANGAQMMLQQADSVALNGSQYFSTTQGKVVFKDSTGVFR